MENEAKARDSSVIALLGPTNTGKTFRAIERMLEHDSGAIGLPLRLLAREVYDKVSMRCGESQTALITGEEKRIPRAPRYFVSTVEAMPLEREVDFVAIDEVQLAAHRERGRVFTSRVLGARGRKETWLMGAETMRSAVAELVPGVRFEKSPRLSSLRSAGASSLSALPKRSALVAFSESRVFELAAKLRDKRGGAAIVMGALSPRARNAQVALYQSGEVDYLVATDAIGMGLNLDVDHVAFADLVKFDGREERELTTAELAQIAGRAGRYTRDGTFGTLGPLRALSEGVVRAIEEHRFPSVSALEWRNDALDFSSIDALLGSLRARPTSKRLRAAEIGEDAQALQTLLRQEEIVRRAGSAREIELLWSVCSVPDYKKLLVDDHAALLTRLFLELTSARERVDGERIERELEALAKPTTDLDVLMGRVADVRLRSYVVHQPGWVREADRLREIARATEDTLSDALHTALVARFVNRAAKRSSRGAVPPAKDSSPFAALAKLLVDDGPRERSPAELVSEIVDAPHDALSIDARGVVSFEGKPVGKLTRGRDLASPDAAVTLDIDGGSRLRVSRRLVAFARDLVVDLVGEWPRDLSAGGRGLVHLLTQSLGTVLARDASVQLEALEQADRRALARSGILLGRTVVYDPKSLKSPAMMKRLALAGVALEPGAPSLPDGRAPSIAVRAGHDAKLLAAVGYLVVGPRAVRADLLERLSGRLARSTEPWPHDRVASTLGCKIAEATLVVAALDGSVETPIAPPR